MEVSKPFVGYLQVFREKHATMLRSTAFVSYPFHDVLTNCSAAYRRLLIENGRVVVRVLKSG